jgi:hypothetical protein
MQHLLEEVLQEVDALNSHGEMQWLKRPSFYEKAKESLNK